MWGRERVIKRALGQNKPGTTSRGWRTSSNWPQWRARWGVRTSTDKKWQWLYYYTMYHLLSPLFNARVPLRVKISFLRDLAKTVGIIRTQSYRYAGEKRTVDKHFNEFFLFLVWWKEQIVSGVCCSSYCFRFIFHLAKKSPKKIWNILYKTDLVKVKA